jgi:surfeit locus 1 family protein
MTRERLSVAGLLWPLALALPAFALLIGLGPWQMQRKAWEEDLIARISARGNQPAVPLADALAQAAGDLE